MGAGQRHCGFLMRLLRDVRGNTLAIMTAALIPLAGLVGGGIDVSRMYILKTRLQHACDAGALAGRKAMGGGTWSYNNYYARAQANQFFDGNIRSGIFSSTDMTREFTENAGRVVGTASATIPMTLMRIFGKMTDTLSVTCDAEMRLPNTDVMFVLDTTGSMGDTPAGDSMSKLASLKVSVKCFYEIVARLDTDATCTTGTPSGGTGSQVQIRFGFVPYATNVNVGKLLSPDWIADTANYQTRSVESVSWSNWDLVDYYTASRYDTCKPAPANTSTREYRVLGPTRTYNGYTYSSWYCIYEARDYNNVTWTYNSLPVTTSLLKNGSGFNSNFQWPIGSGGANVTINWDGCVEERQTVSQASYTPVPSGAKDLDIDSIPSTSDATTQWKPVLPDLIYTRSNGSGWTTNAVSSTSDMRRDYYYACPREAKKLQSWPDANAFDTYVDGLYSEGNTYHDIGLIWGARLMSPTGLFASENAFTPQGGEIERHMIFMTDGDACTGVNNYTAYGVNWFDRRTTGAASAPTEGCTSTGTLTQQVNARTEALCTVIKNKNITLWVITFGYVDPTTVTRMTACASSGRYFSANNAAQLQSTFKSIADQISQLRLTR